MPAASSNAAFVAQAVAARLDVVQPTQHSMWQIYVVHLKAGLMQCGRLLPLQMLPCCST